MSAGGRGVPLSGARGLHARHPARPRPQRAIAQDQPRALHAGRAPRRARDCCRRRCARASASRCASTTTGRGPRRASCGARPGILGRRDRRRCRGRDRAPLARHAARREPAAAPRARLRASSAPTVASRSPVAREALRLLEVDERGLDEMDRRLLEALITQVRRAGRSGSARSAVVVGEEAGTLEDVYEPFLIQEGFIKRTAARPRGHARSRTGTWASSRPRWRELRCARHGAIARARRGAARSCRWLSPPA